MIVHREDPTGTWIVIRNVPEHVNEKSLKAVLLKHVETLQEEEMEKIAIVRFFFFSLMCTTDRAPHSTRAGHSR